MKRNVSYLLFIYRDVSDVVPLTGSECVAVESHRRSLVLAQVRVKIPKKISIKVYELAWPLRRVLVGVAAPFYLLVKRNARIQKS